MLQKQSKRKLTKTINRLSIVSLGFILSISVVGYIQSSPIIEENNEISKMANVQENSLIGISNHFYINEEEEERNENIALLLREIIKRESGGNPEICNSEFGCSAGMGLCGFISSTWNSTLKRMSEENVAMDNYCWQLVGANSSKEHPIFNEECHMTACEWLLLTDGIGHWDSNGSNWGSGPYNLAKYNLLELSF